MTKVLQVAQGASKRVQQLTEQRSTVGTLQLSVCTTQLSRVHRSLVRVSQTEGYQHSSAGCAVTQQGAMQPSSVGAAQISKVQCTSVVSCCSVRCSISQKVRHSSEGCSILSRLHYAQHFAAQFIRVQCSTAKCAWHSSVGCSVVPQNFSQLNRVLHSSECAVYSSSELVMCDSKKMHCTAQQYLSIAQGCSVAKKGAAQLRRVPSSLVACKPPDAYAQCMHDFLMRMLSARKFLPCMLSACMSSLRLFSGYA